MSEERLRKLIDIDRANVKQELFGDPQQVRDAQIKQAQSNEELMEQVRRLQEGMDLLTRQVAAKDQQQRPMTESVFKRAHEEYTSRMYLNALNENITMHIGMPKSKYMKLPIEPFTGKEIYEGLGSGFLQWGHKFVKQLIIAQHSSG